MSDKNSKNIFLGILCFLVVIYLLCPPYNKVAQIDYIYNNVHYLIQNINNDYNNESEYIFHRNNAIYLAKMANKKGAMKEIDNAIVTAPSKLSEREMANLYNDRAKIKIFYSDYKGALDDMLRIKNPGINDFLKIAMLLKEQGKNKLAVAYCNKIINLDVKAYEGYACIADVYAGVGNYDASVIIYDLLIDRVPDKAKYYSDRAKYKKEAGDILGYKEDIKKAKDINPTVDINFSVTYDSIHPKFLDLSITHS